jgi:methionine-S-sulfoxide reductase
MRDPMIVILGIMALLGMGVTFADAEDRAADLSGKQIEKATFAGGCFWCMEPPFDKLDGVLSTTSGYAGGTERDPTYEEVAAGKTGHAEAIQVVYDPSRISYPELLDVFWRNIDPAQVNGQFVDHGRQYRTAVFYHDEEQRRQAVDSKEALQKSGRFSREIVTEIVPLTAFYPAEGYHQDYYKKNPIQYKSYRRGSGRDQFLEKTWKGEE